MTEEQVAIIGVGLIGGSIGAALRAAGKQVVGFDKDPARVQVGLDRGLIDKGEQSLSPLLRDAESVVVAVPIKSIVELLPQIDQLAPRQALVIDTGSVKSEIVNAMGMLDGGQRAIGGHPLAGSERSGPEAANVNLFRDRSFILSPSEKTDPSTIARAKELVSAIGARPSLMAALKHDEILARVSHLPQVIASALVRCLGTDDVSYGADGLRDMTRLAGSDPVMWRDIFVSNRLQVADALSQYLSQLNEIAGLIERADAHELQEWMYRSHSMWSLHAKSAAPSAPERAETASVRGEG